MHKSRLAGFIIDCQTEDLEAAAAFWSAALGLKAESVPGETLYRTLRTDSDQPHLEVQKVGHPSRVHLDIETDDIEAEVRLLLQSNDPFARSTIETLRTGRYAPLTDF